MTGGADSPGYSSPTTIRRRSVAAVVVGLVGSVALVAVGSYWSAQATGRFLVGVGVMLAVEVLIVRRTIEVTHRRAGPQRLTLATVVTIHRGVVLAVLAGVLALENPTGTLVWAPGVLFALAASLDAVDGAVARATDAVTELGDRLDVELDALTVLAGATAAVVAGSAPIAFLAVGLARYCFVVGTWLRRRRGLPVAPLPPSQGRRLLGAAAMVAICLALLPVPGPRPSWYLTTAVMVPFLLNFGRDWLAVSRYPS
ncbi:CDP-alcohol phosphatidyltransferase family protein [Natronobeatus ordinarius]|uniref:CDP-alcohol phosphatidyltransferase family protein n=1 Tax=Natronobeatus ordinarius TaxID=2963433 RepID=UPI0020CF7A26|nr:CDP-alcohol phosphatidyltransferase family protein [Natronobeatus ordinarius]